MLLLVTVSRFREGSVRNVVACCRWILRRAYGFVSSELPATLVNNLGWHVSIHSKREHNLPECIVGCCHP